MQVWQNWQTRMVQVHMSANSCRFKSCSPHHEKLDFIGLFSFFLCLNCWQTHNLISIGEKSNTVAKISNVFAIVFYISFPINLSIIKKQATA